VVAAGSVCRRCTFRLRGVDLSGQVAQIDSAEVACAWAVIWGVHPGAGASPARRCPEPRPRCGC